MCYAVQLAYDDASDPVYNNGWQAGDDGGTGILGAWNFDGTYTTVPNPTPPPDDLHPYVISQAIDDGLKAGATGSAPFNDIGRAWTLFNPDGPNATTPPSETGPDNSPSGKTDIARVGRPIVGNLPVGSTLKVVIDNPAERRFFRGWTLKLNHGGANQCYAGDNCSTELYEPDPPGTTPPDPETLIYPRMSIGTFEYFTYGQWGMSDANEPGPSVPLYVKDNIAPGQVGTDSGMRIEVTLNTLDTYTATMTPLDNPSAAFTHSGSLNLDPDGNPSNGNETYLAGLPIDWIQIEFYNTDSDFYPTIVPGAGQPADYNGNGKVDTADYVVWRKSNGPAADYNEWKKRFGEGAASPARATDFYIRSIEIIGPGGSSGSVPEPGTFSCLIAGAVGLFSLVAQRRPDRG
jgi:hypothetical protein